MHITGIEDTGKKNKNSKVKAEMSKRFPPYYFAKKQITISELSVVYLNTVFKYVMLT